MIGRAAFEIRTRDLRFTNPCKNLRGFDASGDLKPAAGQIRFHGLSPARTLADVAALYVMPEGPCPGLCRKAWDESRDAKTYSGPFPVVAHPPCGPWGLMRGLCTKQDPSCGPRAVEQVRRWGGVLEHPANSLLWQACGLPRPGELPDDFGGRTFFVRQVAWGHSCEKPTWLYVVGVDPYLVLSGIRTGGKATHRVTSGPGGPVLPSATKRARTVTPLPFAQWLVSLAASVSR